MDPMNTEDKNTPGVWTVTAASSKRKSFMVCGSPRPPLPTTHISSCGIYARGCAITTSATATTVGSPAPESGTNNNSNGERSENNQSRKRQQQPPNHYHHSQGGRGRGGGERGGGGGGGQSIQVSCPEGETMRIPLSGTTVPFRVTKRRGRGFASVVFECEREEEGRADAMDEQGRGGAANGPRVVTVKVMSGGKSGMGVCLHEVETLAFLRTKREEAGLTHEQSRFAELASWFYRRSAVGGVDHVCLVFRGGGMSLREAMSMRSSPNAIGRSESSSPSTAWHPEEVVEIARGLLQGVAFLHSVGLVHGDITPDSVFLYPPPMAPSTPRSGNMSERANSAPFDLRLIDFGNAVFAKDAKPGATPGTRSSSYLSPELRKGLPWGTAVDVWAVGSVLSEIMNRMASTETRSRAVFSGSSSAFNGGLGGIGSSSLSGGGARVLESAGAVVGGEASCGGTPIHGDVAVDWAVGGLVPGVGVRSGLIPEGGSTMTAVAGLVERLLREEASRRPTAEEALKDALFSQA